MKKGGKGSASAMSYYLGLTWALCATDAMDSPSGVEPTLPKVRVLRRRSQREASSGVGGRDGAEQADGMMYCVLLCFTTANGVGLETQFFCLRCRHF